MTIVKIEEECGRRIVARIEEGIKGDQGMDAYEVALLEGFVGSREEWLESLIGPPVPVAKELGDDPNLAVSQKLLKDSINKMEDNNSTVVSDAKKYSDASKVSADASAKSATAAKGSESLAETYKNATKVSETNSKASELAAAKSEGNASKSEAAALVSEGKAKDSETKASSSAAAALSSEKASDVSAKAAKASETASKASETAASKSQTAAKASQDAAKTSETNALASKNAAATSETNSKVSETAAKSSETAAKASQTASAASAKSAGTSATNADTSAKAAKASETAANSSKTAAATSAKNAKTSETNAKASEVAAKASETAASESETKAKASETVAKDSETKASASELAAKSSETKAAASEKIAVEAEAKAKIAMDAAIKLEPEIKSNATKAETSAKAAKASEDLAKKWASNPKGQAVEGGEFSSRHWAEVAKDNANGDAYLSKVDNLKSVADKAEARKNLGVPLWDSVEWTDSEDIMTRALRSPLFDLETNSEGVLVHRYASRGGFFTVAPKSPYIPEGQGDYGTFGFVFPRIAGQAVSLWFPSHVKVGSSKTAGVVYRVHEGGNGIKCKDYTLWDNRNHPHIDLGTTVLDARRSLQLDPLVPMGGGKLSYKDYELANLQDIEGVDNKVTLVNESIQALEEDVVLEFERTNEGIQELVTVLEQNTSAIEENSQKIIAISVGELAANTATDLSDKKYLGTSYYVDHSTVVYIMPQYDSEVGKVVAPIDTTTHSLHQIVTVTAADKEIHVKLKLGEPNMSGSIYVSVLREHTLIWESNCIFLNDSMPEPKEDGTAQYLVSYLQIGSNIFLNATEVKFG